MLLGDELRVTRAQREETVGAIATCYAAVAKR